jgi:hypothetical protein
MYLFAHKNPTEARCQWLMPIILAIQEAEIRRIAVQSQPGQVVHETLSQKYHHKKGLTEWLKFKPQYHNNSKKI